MRIIGGLGGIDLARTAATRLWRFGFSGRSRSGRGLRSLAHRVGGGAGRAFDAAFHPGRCIDVTALLIAAGAVAPVAARFALVILPTVLVSGLIPALIARLIAALIPRLAPALIARSALGLVGASIVAAIIGAVEFIAVFAIVIVIATITLLLFFLAGAIVGQHAEIMVGELQIIFGIHAVAGHLRIAGHILVFLKKLGRIAARAVVDAVAIVAAAPVATIGSTVIVPAAIATAGLPVVDQDMVLAFAMSKLTEDTVQSPSPSTAIHWPNMAPPGLAG